MTTTRARHATREPLNLRIKPEDRSIIDRAARLRGKNRTAFVLDAARAAAEETLLDETTVALKPAAFAAFVARLDEPPTPNARLRKTLRAKPPWQPA